MRFFFLELVLGPSAGSCTATTPAEPCAEPRSFSKGRWRQFRKQLFRLPAYDAWRTAKLEDVFYVYGCFKAVSICLNSCNQTPDHRKLITKANAAKLHLSKLLLFKKSWHCGVLSQSHIVFLCFSYVWCDDLTYNGKSVETNSNEGALASWWRPLGQQTSLESLAHFGLCKNVNYKCVRLILFDVMQIRLCPVLCSSFTSFTLCFLQVLQCVMTHFIPSSPSLTSFCWATSAGAPLHGEPRLNPNMTFCSDIFGSQVPESTVVTHDFH